MSLVIVDLGLRSLRGHHAALTSLLAKQAIMNGQSPRILAGFAADSLLDVNIQVEQAFHDVAVYEDEMPDDPLGRLDLWRKAAEKIRQSLEAYRFTAGDTVVVHTATPRVALGLILWLKGLPENKRPIVIANLMMQSGLLFDPDSGKTECYDVITLLQNQEIAKLSQHLSALTFVVSCQSHASEYSKIFNRQISFWPLPLFERPKQLIEKKQQILLYCGDAKSEKGFHLLPDVLRNLQANSYEYEIVVQATLDPNDNSVVKTWSRIQEIAVAWDKVRLVDSYLDNDTFAAMFAESSLVLLAYDHTAYKGRSSGLLWSGLANGCLLVVPNETWLSSELKLWGVPYMAYQYAAKAEQIARAVINASQANVGEALTSGAARFANLMIDHSSLSALLAVSKTRNSLIKPRIYPVASVNAAYRIGYQGNGQAFCISGWNEAEAAHCWSVAEGGMLGLHLSEAVELSSIAFALGVENSGMIEVVLDDVTIYSEEIIEGNHKVICPIGSEAEALHGDHTIWLKITASDDVSSVEERSLGVALFAFQLVVIA